MSSPEVDPTDSPGTLRRFLAYVRPHRRIIAVVLVLTLASSVAGLLQPLLVADVLDTLEIGGNLRDPLLVLVGLIIASNGLNAATIWLGERTSQGMALGIRRGLIRRLMRLRVRELDRSSNGDLITRVTSDSQLLQQASSSGIIQLFDGTITLVAALVIMAFLHLPLFLITAGVLLSIGLVALFFLPRIRRASDATQEEIGVIGAVLERSLGAARTVKANGAEERESTRAEAAAERAYAAGMRGASSQAAIGVLSGLAVQVSFLTVLGVGGAFVAAGTLDLSILIAFLLYLFRLVAPVFSLMAGAGMVFQGLGALRRIEHTHEQAVEDDTEQSTERTDPAPPAISLREVAFGYPDRGPALRSVTLDVPSRARTALVGPSGAGKTTLFALLQRFYEPESGRILMDGVDIRASRLGDLRRRIAYVEQEAPVLEGTIRENLLYGAVDSTDEELADVLRRTRLAEFVAELPQGLDTQVGSRGTALSGGQRQRLAIARALLRKPDVLLLDEVTSHLDALSEAALQEAVETIARDCTVLLIAHRLSTVTSAERIVVLDQGTVRAVGDHASLLAEDSLYAELVSTQMLGDPRPAALAEHPE